MTRRLSLVALTLLLAGSADAATLQVGPDQLYKLPSAAMAAAKAGDAVAIAPGRYVDCAVVSRDNITIAGTGPGVVLADRSCQRKAILVANGNNLTVQDLTLRGARVPDHNGAGIRAQGGYLTVRNVRFEDNENGVVSAANPSATIWIVGSTFIGNGKCDGECAHGIYAGRIGLLHVERSRFFDTHVGHHIKSRAQRTEVIGCDIEDGPNGTSSYLIDIPNGGSVLINSNRMEKGPRTGNGNNTIMIGEEGVSQPINGLVIRDNLFTNDQARKTVFVHNQTTEPAQLVGNRFKGSVQALQGSGSVK